MLPITRVVLFKHGVAHFERTGNITGNDAVELSFKSDEMNDVLKSLTTLDFDGGHFSALSYDSDAPIERRLADLSINIPSSAAITGFVDQMKGAQVNIKTSMDKGSELLTGSILGVEEMRVNTVSTPSPTRQSASLAILTNHGGLRCISFEDIVELNFTDERIKAELNRLMTTQMSRTQSAKKRLTVQAVGQGTRDISIAYVIEAPVWKTSYRLIFLKNSDQTEKTLLQGWAMVDNNSDEDWKDIDLSLVSGLPISFTHDLYTPRYQTRPDIKVKNETLFAPPIVEASIDEFDQPFETNEMDPFDSLSMPMAAAVSAPMKSKLSKRRKNNDYSQAIQSPITNEVSHTELGDLFSYNIDQPVSIKCGQSALVPFLQSTIDAHRILYFNKSIRAVNAMSAVFLNNSSNLTLEGGPLTVFSENNYVGEAMLETLKNNEEKIVPYAIDLNVKIHQSCEISAQTVTKVSKQGQYLHKHARREKVIHYNIHSKNEQNTTLYLDHAFEHGLAFENASERPTELVEISENFWRYKLELKANENTIFEVREAIYSQDSIYIPNIVFEQITSLNTLKLISSEVSHALQNIAELSVKQQQLNQEKAHKQTQIDNIYKDQERLRQNISSLGGSVKENELRARYVNKLSGDEDVMEGLVKNITALEVQVTALDSDINHATDNLSGL